MLRSMLQVDAAVLDNPPTLGDSFRHVQRADENS